MRLRARGAAVCCYIDWAVAVALVCVPIVDRLNARVAVVVGVVPGDERDAVALLRAAGRVCIGGL